jgi:hypothetical protein
MKKEKLSFWVLVVEIAAIIYLHSAKNSQTPTGMVQGRNVHPPAYQLGAMPLTK